ncbi:MAG: inorganic phosphate transporter [Proteobacteria bacterium]|nr:inorganic phosphate transporter [Pseudomonadota bacterium]
MIVAAVAGLYMAWAIGANDVANAMGTSVGSGALTLKQAVVVAAIFEFAGAVIAGSSVTKTVRKGIIDPEVFAATPELLVYGMIAALMAAAVWLSVASKFGWPVSTTHSIVGAIVGFAVVAAGTSAVEWSKVGKIVASWVTSPLLAGTTAFVMFSLLRRFVIAVPDPLARTKRVAPFLVFGTTVIISLVTLWKGLKHLKLDLNSTQTALVAIAFSVLASLVSVVLINRIPDEDPEVEPEFRYKRVEKVFAILQIYTACAVAFAHGSNDVANSIGPMAAAVTTIREGAIVSTATVPLWMLLAGGTGIVIGLGTYGYKVMETVGTRITHLTPSRGYTAEFAAAVTIVVASRFGLPISTTHTLVGAVLGVGLARGLAATNMGVVGQIALSWLVTLPAGAALAIVFFYLLKFSFGG